MGCATSSTSGAVVNSNPVPDSTPYNGAPVSYHFVNTEVKMTSKVFAFSEGQPMSSSDIDTFYPILSTKMAEGFHMVVYRTIPGQFQSGGMMSTSVTFPYQGIFLKREDEEPQSFKLLIEKSAIQPTNMRHGLIPMFSGMTSETKTDTSHLLMSVAQHSQNGGRLITIVPSGMSTSPGVGNMLKGNVSMVCGVDLFFEIPTKPRSNFVYQTVHVPINMSSKVGMGGVKTTVNCDWMGNLVGPLSQGWKMTGIFFDASSTMQSQGMMPSTQMTLNSIWFFEKPEEVVNDNTPRYEGTMIEFQYEISMSVSMSMKSKAKSSISWEGKLAEMGQKGWELASILDYPGVQSMGIGKASMKLLMFFQRKIVS